MEQFIEVYKLEIIYCNPDLTICLGYFKDLKQLFRVQNSFVLNNPGNYKINTDKQTIINHSKHLF